MMEKYVFTLKHSCQKSIVLVFEPTLECTLKYYETLTPTLEHRHTPSMVRELSSADLENHRHEMLRAMARRIVERANVICFDEVQIPHVHIDHFKHNNQSYHVNTGPSCCSHCTSTVLIHVRLRCSDRVYFEQIPRRFEQRIGSNTW